MYQDPICLKQMAPASLSKHSITLMHIHNWHFFPFFFSLLGFLLSGLKNNLRTFVPRGHVVRNAVLNWIKDVKKHLSLPQAPTGKEKHGLQNCTWAVGSMVAALPAGAGAVGAGARRW